MLADVFESAKATAAARARAIPAISRGRGAEDRMIALLLVGQRSSARGPWTSSVGCRGRRRRDTQRYRQADVRSTLLERLCTNSDRAYRFAARLITCCR